MSVRARTVTFSLKQDLTEQIEKYAKWAWILHDKDINTETGEMKEPHYHYYLEFGNARYLSGIAKEFNIPENMIEVVRDKVGILRYLTHSTEKSKGKHEYDKTEVHSSFEYELATESYDMETLYSIIETADSVRDAIRRIQAIGFTGNPLSGVNYIVRTYKDIHAIN